MKGAELAVIVPRVAHCDEDRNREFGDGGIMSSFIRLLYLGIIF